MTQCDAKLLCNSTGGWSLCTSADYINNGGKQDGTVTIFRAWIKACVRSGGAGHAPTIAICPSCTFTSLTSTPISWTCAGGSEITAVSPYMGLQAWISCKRVGINSKGTEGYWSPVTSSMISAVGAVCCR
jgi:hypothetical protein